MPSDVIFGVLKAPDTDTGLVCSKGPYCSGRIDKNILAPVPGFNFFKKKSPDIWVS